MAGNIKTNSITLGDSATDSQNFQLRTNVDGTATLARGAAGDLGDVLTVDAAGLITTAANSINFAANTPTAGMASQLLDWYEEGAFTPTIVGTTTAGVGTYSSQQGMFTRIGNVVRFSIQIIWSAHTGTGKMEVEGLPFQASPSVDAYVANVLSLDLTVPTSTIPTAMVLASSTRIRIYSLSVGTASSISSLNLDNSANLWINGEYRV